MESNHFNVTISVPPSHYDALNGEITLKSTISGAIASIPVKFDPKDKREDAST